MELNYIFGVEVTETFTSVLFVHKQVNMKQRDVT